MTVGDRGGYAPTPFNFVGATAPTAPLLPSTVPPPMFVINTCQESVYAQLLPYFIPTNMVKYQKPLLGFNQFVVLDSVFIKAQVIAFLQLMEISHCTCRTYQHIILSMLSVFKYFSNLSRVLWCVAKIVISYYHVSI